MLQTVDSMARFINLDSIGPYFSLNHWDRLVVIDGLWIKQRMHYIACSMAEQISRLLSISRFGLNMWFVLTTMTSMVMAVDKKRKIIFQSLNLCVYFEFNTSVHNISFCYHS